MFKGQPISRLAFGQMERGHCKAPCGNLEHFKNIPPLQLFFIDLMSKVELRCLALSAINPQVLSAAP
jgi:hypothetical protein